ncbi:MAG: glutamate 5-kinase [bacterium]|nr:glutamate 5-kinase [bacterium]
MSIDEPVRVEVAAAKRIVLKIGTRVIAGDDGHVRQARLLNVVEAAAALRGRGREVLIVSSGAVGLGIDALGFSSMPEDLEERQACAAVGQTRLMGVYEQAFSRLGYTCGQVLLTQGDFDDRMRYLNLRSTLMTLLRHGVIPVINENDAVSTEELAFEENETRPVFGDNDRLSALVATKLGADLLVLLTDVDGVFDRDPRVHNDARLLSTIEAPGAGIESASETSAALGRGGMKSKVEAAHVVARAGCQAVIASGIEAGVLAAVLAGRALGTWFPARGELAAKRRWIAFAAKARGTLEIDDGAVEALTERGASLLAAGVLRVEGDFRPGDVIELRDRSGGLVGRGMVYCDADSARGWCGGKPPEGIRNHHALVHRDHMVLEG